MKQDASFVSLNYDRAEEFFRWGMRGHGMQSFLFAERLLPDVKDPIDFLALTLRAERIVRKHLLPEGDAT